MTTIAHHLRHCLHQAGTTEVSEAASVQKELTRVGAFSNNLRKKEGRADKHLKQNLTVPHQNLHACRWRGSRLLDIVHALENKEGAGGSGQIVERTGKPERDPRYQRLAGVPTEE